MTRRKGFTLVELLVVIAIIGLLSTLAVVALNNARAKARDARRVSDIKQIQMALDLYFDDKNGYPTHSGGVTLGVGSYACFGTAGFTVAGCSGEYMGQVPANPTPNGANYLYAGTGSTYQITFQTENSNVGGLSGTLHTATQKGLQ